MLAHTTDVKLRKWQKRRLDKFQKVYKEMIASQPQPNSEEADCSKGQDWHNGNIAARAFVMVVQSDTEDLDASGAFPADEVSFVSLCFCTLKAPGEDSFLNICILSHRALQSALYLKSNCCQSFEAFRFVFSSDALKL